MALSIFTEMAREFPTDARVHSALGRTYHEIGNLIAAESEYKQSVSYDTSTYEAWNNLGAALHFEGEQRQALDAWEKAIELDGKEFDAMFNLGLRAAALGETQRSRSALEQFVDSAPAQKYGEDIQTANEILQRLPG